MKKILILTVTAGNGHNSNAKAIKEKLETLEKENVEVKTIDLLKEFATKKDFWITNDGYNLAMAYLPNTYNYFYNVCKNFKPSNRYSNAAQTIPLKTLAKLYKEINEYQPDVIYCTHFYCAIALSDLKLAYSLPCTTIVSSLDYVNSPFWENAIHIDYFVLPNNDFVPECISKGFQEKQLLPFGISVRDKFNDVLEKKQARKQLNLEEDLFTIMIMFGGGNWGGGYKIFKKLIGVCKNEKLQIIMINGHNKKSYEKIEKTIFPKNLKIVNVGFTNLIDVYMSASNLVISKSGGLSLTEMINKQIPMLITHKVYGQEKHNLNYLIQKQIASSFKNKKQLKQQILKLKNNKNYYNKLVENSKKLKTNGIQKLANFILNQPSAVYDESYIQNIDYNKVIPTVKKAMKQKRKMEKLSLKK